MNGLNPKNDESVLKKIGSWETYERIEFNESTTRIDGKIESIGLDKMMIRF